MRRSGKACHRFYEVGGRFRVLLQDDGSARVSFNSYLRATSWFGCASDRQVTPRVLRCSPFGRSPTSFQRLAHRIDRPHRQRFHFIIETRRFYCVAVSRSLASLKGTDSSALAPPPGLLTRLREPPKPSTTL